MKKNVASQKIGAQMITAADGSAFTGSVTVSVTGDAGTQATGSVGAGACTHEGNGYHTYAPAQAETNYDLVAFTFTGTGAIPTTIQVFTHITPGEAGGALIAGSNAATTFATLTVTGATTLTGNVSLAAGMNITQSTTNGNALTLTGNGAGYGLRVIAGATGDGMRVESSGSGSSAFVAAGQAYGIYSDGQAAAGYGFGLSGGTGSLLASGKITATNANNDITLGATSVAAIQSGLATAIMLTVVRDIALKLDDLVQDDGLGNYTLAANSGEVMLGTAGENSIAAAVKQFQFTEGYRANGAAPTLEQAICEILAHLGESSISGVTKTIKKLDHTTTAETFTLDSATTPSSVTRAT